MINDLNILWQALVKEASLDGLVCNISILDTNIHDWSNFLDYVQTNFPYKYISKGSQDELPKKIDDSFFHYEELRFLELHIGNFSFECFILTSEEIELTVVPSMIVGLSQVELFFRFIANISLQLKKEVKISIEGYSYWLIIFSFARKIFLTGNGIEICSLDEFLKSSKF